MTLKVEKHVNLTVSMTVSDDTTNTKNSGLHVIL